MGRKKKEEKNNNSEDLGDRPLRFNIASEAKRGVIAVFLMALALVILLGFIGKAGVIGDKVNLATSIAMGWAKLFLPIFLIIAGIVLFFRKKKSFYAFKIIGLLLMLSSIAGFFHWFLKASDMLSAAKAGSNGGYVGYGVTYLLVKYFGGAGGLVIILALFFIGLILTFNFTIFNAIAKLWKKEEPEETPPVELPENIPAESKPESPLPQEQPLLLEPAEDDAKDNIGKVEFAEGNDQYIDKKIADEIIGSSGFVSRKRSIDTKIKDKRKSNDWELPPLDLLDEGEEEVKAENTKDKENQKIIKDTFSHFGIEVIEVEIRVGPSVTQYSFRPEEGVKLSKIIALQDNLALALARHPIRIEAPIPGKSFIGVEVPNEKPSIVKIRSILDRDDFLNRSSSLTLALGKDVNAEHIYEDLDKMPHLLVAGATNTGKSVCINAIIVALLYQNTPDNLEFLMVDPKRVELSRYDGIPHLRSKVIVESSKVVNMLKWAVGEMERRYRHLQDVAALNIASYNSKVGSGKKRKYTDPETGAVVEETLEKMSYLVIVIDELAELMSSHGKDVEGAIIRLAQMARAVGIHLIVSTQRPEVKVITGLIKANITNRIAFRVATQIDSRTILDMSGAEKLLGNGDMLYISPINPKPKRIQGVFVSEAEVKRVVKFWKNQDKENGEKDEDEIVGSKKILEFSESPINEEDDEYFEAAREEVVRSKKASASLLQRRLRIGYPKAARLLDLLEQRGVIGPPDGNKPREIIGAGDETQYVDPINDQQQRDKWNF